MNRKLMGLVGSLMNEVRQQLLENLEASKQRRIPKEVCLAS